ncbi:hypothetical protein ACNKU7_04575 [Microbulbifer sp. SA54]|uniref:hypothetical protein n=1 Tax=Microbulbifer sp. SA54 TaxID=3401577 RepID=UPI003AADB549
MTIKLYHQVGHNANWNIDSYSEDDVGDGLILSPVHQPIHQIENLDAEIKRTSFFDPQFYLPSSQKNKLQSYDFFPEVVSGGFSTIDFTTHAFDSAERCVNFQLLQGFDRIVIPARYYGQMVTDYEIKQEAYTVAPFLQCIRASRVEQPVYLTLPLTSHMVLDAEYRNRLLNWITSYPEIEGVYLFIDSDRGRKQIQESSLIYESLRFLKDLKLAELDVVVGYSNTESLLYGLVGDVSITCGSFENTRMFSLDKFLVSDDGRRGPKARVYVPGLLNWIQFSQAREVNEEIPGLWADIYQPSCYGDAAFSAVTEPTFNQPGLYKDYFINFSRQVDELASLDIAGRYDLLRNWLRSAEHYYSEIESARIDLELHGSGDHIQPWLSAINKYARDYII